MGRFRSTFRSSRSADWPRSRSRRAVRGYVQLFPNETYYITYARGVEAIRTQMLYISEIQSSSWWTWYLISWQFVPTVHYLYALAISFHLFPVKGNIKPYNFSQEFVHHTNRMTAGDPMAEDTTVGATITTAHADKVWNIFLRLG